MRACQLGRQQHTYREKCNEWNSGKWLELLLHKRYENTRQKRKLRTSKLSIIYFYTDPCITLNELNVFSQNNDPLCRRRFSLTSIKRLLLWEWETSCELQTKFIHWIRKHFCIFLFHCCSNWGTKCLINFNSHSPIIVQIESFCFPFPFLCFSIVKMGIF